MVARSSRAGGALSMSHSQTDLQLIRMLSDRLERISVDSVWAHRASGVRGALLRHIEMNEMHLPSDIMQLNTLVLIAFRILKEAASKRIS